jgi:hypothetical protein
MTLLAALPRPDVDRRAYFAGYFDAEGTVGVFPANAGRSWRTRIEFGQTNPCVLQQLQMFYGGSMHVVQRARANWRDKYHWALTRFNAVACFLEDIRPFIGEKREQVEAVLGRFSTRMPAKDAQRLITDLKRMKQVELTVRKLPTSVKSRKKARTRCTVEGCSRSARAQGLCTRDYQRARTAGTLTALQPKRGARSFARGNVASTELAYFAGYFDGDGSVDVRRRSNTWHLAIVFNQTRSEALIRLHAVYGGNLRFRKRAAPRRNQLTWTLTQRSAVLTFLRDIQPFVIEKCEEVTAILADYRSTMSDAEAHKLLQSLRRQRPKRIQAALVANENP